MNDTDVRVAIFGCTLIVVFWGMIVPLTQCKWFRKLLTGEDGSRKKKGN